MAGPADALAQFRRHGGRLAAAAARFSDAPRPWLDLSTGVNPRPYPLRPVPRSALARLPDPQETAAAEAAAARAFGAPADRVAAVPGSEIALRLLPRLLGARSVAIAAATYSGHAEAWRAAGVMAAADPDAAEAWVVVNPNNPDGAVTPAADILASAERRWTIVDEAFADPAREHSVADHAKGRLVVLRSFGKFYGLPGLRLGLSWPTRLWSPRSASPRATGPSAPRPSRRPGSPMPTTPGRRPPARASPATPGASTPCCGRAA